MASQSQQYPPQNSLSKSFNNTKNIQKSKNIQKNQKSQKIEEEPIPSLSAANSLRQIQYELSQSNNLQTQYKIDHAQLRKNQQQVFGADSRLPLNAEADPRFSKSSFLSNNTAYIFNNGSQIQNGLQGRGANNDDHDNDVLELHNGGDPRAVSKQINSKVLDLSKGQQQFSKMSKGSFQTIAQNKVASLLQARFRLVPGEALQSLGLTPDLIFEKWDLYFNEPAPKESNEDFKQLVVIALSNALVRDFQEGDLVKNYLSFKKRNNSLPVEAKFDCSYFEGVLQQANEDIREVVSHLREAPEDIIAALGLASDVYLKYAVGKEVVRVIPRVINCGKIEPIRAITCQRIGQLVKVQGRVTKVESVKILVNRLSMVCKECHASFLYYLRDGLYEQPSKCPEPNCKSKIFSFHKNLTKTKLIQRVVIQSTHDDSVLQTDAQNTIFPQAAQSSGGVQFMVVELRESMVNTLNLNDIVMVDGIIKIEPSAFKPKGVTRFKGVYDYYLHCNSFQVLTGPQQSLQTKQVLQQNQGQEEGIQNEFTNQKNKKKSGVEQKFSKTLNSPLLPYFMAFNLCPQIPGNLMAKLGILLQLVAGELNQDKAKGGGMKMREQMHILLLGEKEVGKRAIMQFVDSLSTQNSLFSGKPGQIGELTCEVTKSKSNEVQVNPGCLVSSQEGVCCIQGIEKLEVGHQQIAEVMDFGQLSIAKKGVIELIEAKTKVLASAEPKGKLNQQKAVMDNFKLSPSFIERFDLVFLLSDYRQNISLGQFQKNTLEAVEQSKHQNYNKSKNFSTNSLQSSLIGDSGQDDLLGSIEASEQDLQEVMEQNCKYSEKLSMICSVLETVDPMQSRLNLKDFSTIIKYLKAKKSPKLSKSAALSLRDYYVSLQSTSCSLQTLIPVTSRCLESLVRLSTARAKFRNAKKVMLEDVEEVKQFYDEMLLKSSFDLTGEEHKNNQNANGLDKKKKNQINKDDVSAYSVPKQTKVFLELLDEQAKLRGDKVFGYADLKEIARNIKMQVGDFQVFIEKLNMAGHFLKKGSNQYQLLTESFL